MADMIDLPSWVKDAKLKNKQEIGFVKLINDLNGKKSCESVLIDAFKGVFSNYDSSFDCPLMELEEKLLELKEKELASKVIKGEYDHVRVYYISDQETSTFDDVMRMLYQD